MRRTDGRTGDNSTHHSTGAAGWRTAVAVKLSRLVRRVGGREGVPAAAAEQVIGR